MGRRPISWYCRSNSRFATCRCRSLQQLRTRAVSLRRLVAPFSALLLCGVVAISPVGATRCAGQVLRDAQAPAADRLPADDAVVARVNGAPIPFREVKQQLSSLLQGREVPANAMPLLLAQGLEQVIARELVAAEMRLKNLKPTPEDLKTAEENFTKNLARRGVSREEYLRQSYLTEVDLEKVRYWEICWNRYSRDLLTNDDLQKYFAAHHRDFDGTELRVSHVLLRIEGTQDQGTLAAAAQKAQAIREEIVNGRLNFADAALRFSAGPSREHGGDLGFIPRRDRMVEEFSAAAFRLKVGEISPPTVTVFGVHLITVTEEKPGRIIWQDVREQLVAAAQVPLFRQLAAHLRKTAEVEYTGLIPRLDPATGKVVPGS
ncbi:MAG: hypothetical protein C0483_08470 [Pirellula sp.]|nr:hypothetical protein [Pirellula sp.]